LDHPCDHYIEQSLRIARRLLALADGGDSTRDDDGCGILFGVLRDCAYKIRRQALREQAAHAKEHGRPHGRGEADPDPRSRIVGKSAAW